MLRGDDHRSQGDGVARRRLRRERPVRRRVFVSDRPCLRPLVAALPPPPGGEQAVMDDRQLLEAMRTGRGDRGEPVVTGLDATVEALNQRLVSILALPRDASADGLACSACSWLGRAPQAADVCPIDGGRLEYVEDLYERMLGTALAQ